METVTDFIFGGSKVTADGDCSHKIKRCLLLGRKVIVNLDSLLKSRDIPLPTKVCLVKAMFFPVVMLGFPGGSDGKASAGMRETRVQFLGREDPLEKEMAIHSSTLAWKTPWMEAPDRLQSMGSQSAGHD